MKNQRGQSLVEILIGLGIVSILISASTYALVAVLKTSTLTEQNQTAGLVGNSLMDSAITLAEGNWNTVYNLTKGLANHYFIVNSPTTTPLAVAGDESILSENITNGLVGHWKFDETGGSWAYDSSGSGNLGSLVNSPTRTVSASCKVGACLSFDGTSNYVSVPTNVSLNPTDITVIVWVNPSDTSGHRRVVNKNGTTGYMVNIYAGGFETYVGGQNVGSGGTVSTGRYTQLALTVGNGQVKLYNNSILKKTATLTGTMDGSTAVLTIASNSPPASSRFAGYIDDVRVYNRALSSTEISQLYNSSVYSRYFYADNVNRKACGTGDITTNATTTCAGSANDIVEDPSTQKVTVGTTWNIKGALQTVENSGYVARWLNSYTNQTDWNGSSGTAGAITDFGSNFYDYSNISTTTSGSIKITGY